MSQSSTILEICEESPKRRTAITRMQVNQRLGITDKPLDQIYLTITMSLEATKSDDSNKNIRLKNTT